MSEDKKLWYRIGFDQKGKAQLNVMAEVGTNREQRVAMAFLAPYSESEDSTNMERIHSINFSDNGYPNGFYPTVEEAQEAVKATLQMQIDRIQQAIQEVDNTSATELSLAN